MTERDFQIQFERQLETIIPEYNKTIKLDSDTIFQLINSAKDQYIVSLYRIFQQNQEIDDKLRTLVLTQVIGQDQFTKDGNRWSTKYPDNYMFTLGEEVSIEIKNNKCPNLINKSRDVIEATLENVDRIIENSLSEYHLHHNQARPIRLHTNNNIVLITDGNYDIAEYKLTYLKQAKELGNSLTEEYTDLPSITHKEIIDIAVNMLLSRLSANKSEKDDNN